LPRDRAVLVGLDEHGSWALVHATGAQRANRDFVLQAVARDGNSLLYAAESLRLDREVVLTAVAQNGHALRHASPYLRQDRTFALEAVARHSNAMLFVSTELREDKTFVLEAVQAGCSLEYVAAPLRTWCLKREELLAVMRTSVGARDAETLSKTLKDSEAHDLPEVDLVEARLALAKLVKYSRVGSLWEPLSPGLDGRLAPVALVKGSWLVELSGRGGRLPRRQDLPREAAWEGEELRRDAEQYEAEARQRRPHKVVAISHCWLRREHPDPHGEQLAIVSKLIERRMQDVGPGVDLAVFWDYCSLFQEPRSGDEAAAFAESLLSLSMWYAHERTEKWLLTRPPATCSLPGDLADTGALGEALPVLPYPQRGWTHFEHAIAELLSCEGRTRSQLIDIGMAPLGEALPQWAQVQWSCSARRNPPRVPEHFNQELAAKSFSEPSDLALLQEAYRVTFSEVVASSRVLVFCDLDWGDAEAPSLAAAVRHFNALQAIELEGNLFGDVGAAELFAAFATCPALRRIVLRANRIGDPGAERLVAELPACRKLEALDLSFNVIGNDGAGHFALMFEAGVNPPLQELRLNSNDIGNFMKERLCSAVEAGQGLSLELHL